jgi:non-ribosomal peptide synthase protein (TIGR01720 family)
MSSDKEGMISIGKPIPNVRFYLLDSALNPVTVGVTGVLHIGGAGVSAGYHRLPGLTATRFIPDPFSDTPGKRLFDTGDLVRYRMDGNLDFLGRSDQLVKIHGVRIELGEIEAVLNRHASVAETAVIVRQDAADNPRLIAYVVWQPGAEATVAELRAFAAEHLPMSMIPSNFVVLNALPQTPNRKVDRQALPVPEQDRDILEVAYVPPQTAQEAALAEIWSNLLGIYRVGIHDNFFHLGGDSLLAMRVVLEANRVGLGVTIKQLFMHQTIAGLASVATTPQTIHAVQEPVTGTLPLNHIQQDFLNRGYNLKYWMTGPVLAIPDCQPRLLRQATEAIWQHHDMLRLRVVHDTSGWQQFIAEPNEEVPFQIVDLSGQPEVSQGYNALEKLITGDALDWLEPLEMAKGPLFQALLYDTGHGNPHYLLLFCHYLTADPTSWRIVAEDLHTAYKQLQQELAIKLPPKTTSYKYYTEQLATFAQTEKVKQEASYWLSARWQQAPVLPTDHCLGPNHMKSRQSYTVALSLEETQALLAIAHEGFLLQDVLATALVLTLQRWLQSSTLLVGIQGHGRITSFPEVDLTRTVGWFAHRTPVLFQLEKNMGDDEAVQTVSEQLAAALERGTNYGTLRYLCRDETITQGLQRMPQPQITFNNFGEIDAPSSRKDDSDLFQLVGSVWGDRSDPLAVRSTQLSILPRLFGKQLFVNWLYSDNYYRQETIAHWAGNMLTTLQRLIGCRRED